MDWALTSDVAGRLLVAAVLGALIGLEREADDHPAGIRTMLMVALGASLFGIVSTLGFDEFLAERERTNVQVDVTRVASQVVVGIGFLGAGLVFRHGEKVMNLTTAASMWVTSAIGLTAGVGDLGAAVAATVVALVALYLLPFGIRRLVGRIRRDRRHLWLEPTEAGGLAALRQAIDGIDGLEVVSWRAEKLDERVQAHCQVVGQPGRDVDADIARLLDSPLVRRVVYASGTGDES